jgi:hypothetical protein
LERRRDIDDRSEQGRPLFAMSASGKTRKAQIEQNTSAYTP